MADELKEKYGRDLEEIKINYQKNLNEPANYYGLSHIAQFENVKNVILKSGAGFIVILTGNIFTMPGLPKVPASEKIDIDENGEIVGIF